MKAKVAAQNVLASMMQRTYERERARTRSERAARPGVLFTSVSRAVPGGNIERVMRRMKERGLSERFEFLTYFKPDIKTASSISELYVFAQLAARADIVFLDDYHPYLYLIDFPREVKVVQLWHAVGSFKKIGFSRERADSEQRRKVSRAHRSYTHIIVSAEVDRAHYADAFNQPIERVYATGTPRIDDFLDPVRLERSRAAFFERFPQAREKRVVLFAPTFRGDDVRAAGYDFGKLDFARIAGICRKRNALFCTKFHPLVKGFSGVPEECADVVMDASDLREVNDVLPAADLLVTDYSSVVYEASLLELPMLFFAYDLADYERTRGFYEPYETFVPGPIIREPHAFEETLDSVLAALSEKSAGSVQISELKARSRAFSERHFAYRDRNSADRVIDLVCGDAS